MKETAQTIKLKELPKREVDIVARPVKNNPPFYDVGYRYKGTKAFHTLHENLTEVEASKISLKYLLKDN